MKAEWIVHSGSRKLLLFFNGWGMDRRVAEWLVSSSSAFAGRDFAVVYDYRTPSLPGWLGEAVDGADSVELLAWSMGVWAAARAGLDKVDFAVALNGTPWPRDAGRGIASEVFMGTLDGWNDLNRQRFERRMMTGVPPEIVETVRSERSCAGQKEELQAIADVLSIDREQAVAAWNYSKAIVGECDQIFRAENQCCAWLEAGVPVTEYPAMPHFPFHHPEVLEELLA
ncbi:MAG TPA: DUF452 family protein [Chlorobaculum parvum]|uniref:DUF452 family protein n=1 Tax=Chlorobaculum parvum TaxID=274539 RepID=A0A7C5HFL8_9CHLB|nr:DUF452 family protein [Chlorobaculum parvum]